MPRDFDHDDVGWLKNPDEYLYGLNQTIQNAHVNAVIDSVVAGLAADPRRKFTYVEMFFFEGWWAQQDEEVRATVRKLVAEKRLMFACGGWTMPDEAAPIYQEYLDIYTLGHRFIKEQVGGTVQTASQLDPFGHSATHAVLMRDAGMDAVFFARMSHTEYTWRRETKGRQFWWQPSKTRPNVKIFAEILPFLTYCTPSQVSWDLSDELGSCFRDSTCVDHQFIVDNKNMAQYNVPRYVDTAVQLAATLGNMTQGNDLLLMSGCDFQWSAGMWNFANNDKLIRALNKDGRISARYSTLHEYAQFKIKDTTAQYPTRDGDIFPYDDSLDGHNWWSGYFTSRPALKRYARTVSSLYTTSRQLRGLLGAAGHEFSKLARSLGIVSHHDAIAGTAKQHVAFWYAKALSDGVDEDLAGLSAAAKTAWGVSGLGFCARRNESECSATAGISGSGQQVVMVWNSDGRSKSTWVEVPVPSASVKAVGPAVLQWQVHRTPLDVNQTNITSV